MRPKIICHMMSSVDGRLVTYRYTLPFDGKSMDDVSAQYFSISNELNGQAVMIGRKTVQENFMPKTFENNDYFPTENPTTFIGKRDAASTIIVIDPKGKIYYENTDNDNFIAILNEKVSDQYLSHLRNNGVSYVFAGPEGNDIAKAMDILGNDFGLNKILLEGGGFINGAFLKAGLIDELSLMLYPGVDGLAGMPAIFEYEGKENEQPAQGQALELISVKQLPDGIMWLYYKFHKV